MPQLLFEVEVGATDEETINWIDGHETMIEIYWYLTTYYECPICGKGDTSKERQYSEKPIEPHKRFVYEYDTVCAAHDLAGVC